MPSAPDGTPLGHLVLDPGGDEVLYPVLDRMFLGRECAGIDTSRRILIDESDVSRSHCEVRLDVDGDRAYVVDESTNGTRLNGVRISRAVLTPLKPGDRIAVASKVFEFRSSRFANLATANVHLTMMPIRLTTMVLVVGDIVNYSTISQVTDNNTIALSLQRLWGELGAVLTAHRGTLNHYAGDALYAVWDPDGLPDASELAIDFALAADRRLEQFSHELALRGPDGRPVQMGWSVVAGDVAVTSMTRSDAVIGDATNLAFRLSGIAGRDGRARVMVTSRIKAGVLHSYRWGDPEDVDTKGRTGRETIHPVLGRIAQAGGPPHPA